MNNYIQKNGLAQFWDRDFRRMELAKWVYNHPDEAEELIAILEERMEEIESEEE